MRRMLGSLRRSRWIECQRCGRAVPSGGACPNCREQDRRRYANPYGPRPKQVAIRRPDGRIVYACPAPPPLASDAVATAERPLPVPAPAKPAVRQETAPPIEEAPSSKTAVQPEPAKKRHRTGRSRKIRNAVRGWLREELRQGGGWLPVRTIRKRAHIMGIAWSTLKLVRKDEGILSVRSHRYGGRRAWVLNGL